MENTAAHNAKTPGTVRPPSETPEMIFWIPEIPISSPTKARIEARIMGALKKGRASVITEYMRDDKAISSKMIRKSLEHKDELITQILFEASDYLSNGLATIINFYNPALIVMGGGLIDAVDEFYERTITKAKAKALPVPASKIRFEKAKLGDFSGVVGACFLEEAQKLKKTSNVLR